MKYYKLRVDLENVDLTHIINLINSYSNTYSYVCEDGKTQNPHTHWYFSTEFSPENIRKNLRTLGLKGNSSYSLKELDEQYPIEYFAYLCKQNNPVYKNIPQEIIEESKAYNKKVQEEIKEKKVKKRKVVQILIEYCDKEIKHYLESEQKQSLPGHYPNPLHLIHKIMLYHLENEILIRDFTIQSYVTTILCKISPSYLSRYIANMGSKFA